MDVSGMVDLEFQMMYIFRKKEKENKKDDEFRQRDRYER